MKKIEILPSSSALWLQTKDGRYKVHVEVYLDGLRDESHHCDRDYDLLSQASNAAINALMEEATSEVRLIKKPLKK